MIQSLGCPRVVSPGCFSSTTSCPSRDPLRLVGRVSQHLGHATNGNGKHARCVVVLCFGGHGKNDENNFSGEHKVERSTLLSTMPCTARRLQLLATCGALLLVLAARTFVPSRRRKHRPDGGTREPPAGMHRHKPQPLPSAILPPPSPPPPLTTTLAANTTLVLSAVIDARHSLRGGGALHHARRRRPRARRRLHQERSAQDRLRGPPCSMPTTQTRPRAGGCSSTTAPSACSWAPGATNAAATFTACVPGGTSPAGKLTKRVPFAPCGAAAVATAAAPRPGLAWLFEAGHSKSSAWANPCHWALRLPVLERRARRPAAPATRALGSAPLPGHARRAARGSGRRWRRHLGSSCRRVGRPTGSRAR